MADSYQTSPPDPGGDTFKAYDDGSVKWPAGVTSYVSTLGDPDTVVPVLPTQGLPVKQETGHTFQVGNGGTFAVQVSNFPSGFLSAQSGTWNVGITNATLAVTQSGTWNVGITNATLAVTQSGTWNVGITGSIAVTGGLTDAELRASAVPVSLASVPSHNVTNAGTFAVQVTSLPTLPSGTNVIGHVITDSGSVVAASQSGTWNITNISGTVSLPTGAATEAKQPALGTAGTASADVITVQGIASMTALKVDGSAVTQPVSDGGGSLTVDGSVSVSGLVPGVSATSLGKAEDSIAADGDTGVAVWAVRKDTPATTVGAAGDYAPFEVDANGCLWVNSSNYTQPVSNAGTFAVQAAQSGLWSVSISGGVISTGGLTDAELRATPVPVSAAQSGTWNIGTVTTLTGITNVVHVDDNGGSVTVDAPVGTPVFVRLSDGSSAITNLATNLAQVAGATVATGHGTASGSIRVELPTDGTGIIAGITNNVSTIGAGLTTNGTLNGVTTTLTLSSLARAHSVARVSVTASTYTASNRFRIYGSPDGTNYFQLAFTDTIGVVSTNGVLDPVAGSQYLVNIAGLTEVRVSQDTAGAGTGTWRIEASSAGSGQLQSIADGGGSITVDNAGTFVVQENGAALTALQLIDDPVATLGTTTYTEATTKGFVIGAVRRDADSTLVNTTNEVGPLQIDATGRLKTIATNTGTFVVQENGAALTALQLIDDTVFTDDAAFTPAVSKVLAVGMQADETSADSVNEGDIGCPRMTLDRQQIIADYAHASAGATGYHLVAAGSTNATVIKASAGTVFSISVFNVAASPRYIKFVDKATSPTAGSETILQVVGIKGSNEPNRIEFPKGLRFDTGISFFIVTGIGDSNNTAVSAGDLTLDVTYK